MEEAEDIAAPEGDAAGGRSETRAREVEENRTAAVPAPGAGVVGEDDDDVVEVVRAPQVLGAGWVGVAHRTVVVRVTWGVAPAVARRKRTDLETGPWPRNPAGPVEDPEELERPAWGCSVALALEAPDPAPAKRTGHDERTEKKPPLRARAAASSHKKLTTAGLSSHLPTWALIHAGPGDYGIVPRGASRPLSGKKRRLRSGRS